MHINLAKTKDEIGQTCRILQQLRPQYSLESLIKAVELQMAHDYQLAFCRDNNTYIGAMGFVTGYKLAWNKHIYIDDLVVSEHYRSKGAGKALLDWIREYAITNSCEQIHLDSGVQRFDAHRFYLNHGFRIASHHFSISILK